MDKQSVAELQAVLTGGVMFWGIARLIHWVLSRTDESKRIHGLFIPEWVGGVFAFSGLIALWWSGPAPNIPAPPSRTFAVFGLVVGLAIGWVHGNIRVGRYHARAEDANVSEHVSLKESVDDRNPYKSTGTML